MKEIKVKNYHHTLSDTVVRIIVDVLGFINEDYGKSKLCDFFIGRPSNKMIYNEDINNPYFGILAFMSKTYLERVLDALVEAGFIKVIVKSYKGILYDSLVLTSLAKEIEDFEIDFSIFLDQEEYPKPLFIEIKRLILLRKKQTGIDLYTIANDTVREMCIKLPQSKESFLKINGIGDFFIEHFYPDIKSLITNYIENKHDFNQVVIDNAKKEYYDKQKNYKTGSDYSACF